MSPAILNPPELYIFKNLRLRIPSKACPLIENLPLILDTSNDIPMTDPVP